MSEPLLAGINELGPEPAISVGGRGLSYGELREVSAALAAELEASSASRSGPSRRSRPASPPSPPSARASRSCR